MSLLGTPQKLKSSDPVFKTPMSFSPRLVGEQVRPSPSKIELWKEQLGLTDEVDMNGSEGDGPDSLSNSDDDLEADLNLKNGTCPLIEFQALQRELDERNAQRDELLFRVKSLTDKNKVYRTRLHKEEATKKQQMRILQRTHQVQLQEKDMLLTNLQDIIHEQESKISALEEQIAQQETNHMNSDDTKLSVGIGGLIQQIKRLETEKVDLTSQLLTAEGDKEIAQEEVQCELKHLIMDRDKYERENHQLQEEVVHLRSTKGQGYNTDTEKQLQKLEVENDRLQMELDEIKRSIGKAGPEDGHDEDDGNEFAIIQKLEEENEKLRKRLVETKHELLSKVKMLNEIESVHRQQVRKLTSENQVISREIRELTAQLTSLQAQEPEVVTKVERVAVEIESQKAKQDLDLARTENQELKQEVTSLQAACDSTNAQLSDSQAKCLSLEQQLVSCSDQIEVLQRDLQKQMDGLRKGKDKQMHKFRQHAERHLKAFSAHLKRLRANISLLGPIVSGIVQDYDEVRIMCKALPQNMNSVIRDTTNQICKALGEVNESNQDLVRKYRKEMHLRKKYHNELVELKGNIRVFCRVRPKIKEDGEGSQAEMMINFDEYDDSLVQVMYKTRPQAFELDKVFTPDSTQGEVFEEVKALVTCCIDGYNVCIFAYGQTGSGKTHTMEGTRNNPGINQRALQTLFSETTERRGEWEYTITVSVIEIYNEMIRDLLTNDTTYKLEVKMNPDGGLYVPGLTQCEVHTVDDINQVFTLGKENRATATTNMNEHSSRSHALLCINVIGSNKTTGAKTIGKLNLVDLAGSERVSKSGADGTRLKEAQNINKSLSSLGDVIQALRSKQNHVPYRNSKLTYLLQDSLGGDSKTLMIVQVAPVEKNVGETVASLSFAQRVKSVELGVATKRTEGAEMVELKEKIAQYEEQLGISGYRSSVRSTTPLRSNKKK